MSTRVLGSGPSILRRLRSSKPQEGQACALATARGDGASGTVPGGVSGEPAAPGAPSLPDSMVIAAPFTGQIIDVEQLRSLARSGRDLNGANLSGLKLQNAEDVMLAVKAGARLGRVSLQGANLAGADLREARLCGANLSEANLQGANLTEADLREANLRQSCLRGANLGAGDLEAVNLMQADLRGANLAGAILDDANLQQSNLRGADLWEADLVGANLMQADLGGADLGAADLEGANLRGANLREADLRGANLIGAHQWDATRPGENLWYALTSGLPSERLDGARLSLTGSFALNRILAGGDLSRSRWSSPADESVVRRFLAPLLRAIAGNLAGGPAIGELLARGFDHWSNDGRSVLTSIDSIAHTSLSIKTAMMQEICEGLAARTDAELAPVAGPVLEVLSRHPRYLEKHRQLMTRLTRAILLTPGITSLRVDFQASKREVFLVRDVRSS